MNYIPNTKKYGNFNLELSKDNTILLRCDKNAKGVVVVPPTVFKIKEGAFKGCKKLISIKIPRSVSIIEDHAFEDCENLKSINLPERITSISKCAFAGCSSLTSIVIPDGVTEIKGGAFNGCSSLTSIVIPESVIRIGKQPNSTSDESPEREKDPVSPERVKEPVNFLTPIPNHIREFSPVSIETETKRLLDLKSTKTKVNDVKIVFEQKFFDDLAQITEQILSLVFGCCSSLHEIHLKHKNPIDFSDAFSYSVDVSKITLYVPEGSGEAYREHKFYKYFKEIIEEE